MVAPSADAAKTGIVLYGARGTAASRRFIRAMERGPGISVLSWIVAIFSTIRSEFRRDSRKLAWFRDIPQDPTGRVRGRSRTACSRPTALRRRLAACD